ncbi:VOC family protein [Saccharothrix violaceirubra]|uniref:Putative 3-demethylubiquinone-9 3-methyltransferase (Glyoxalase superfamily) n=1 Tax=Saccharothrix violaceirubra TaxID=413306 RepID=A0A7W7T6X9_9PSEU|nr:VOC family protein [Saccharothrix violaceirubra]MBB4967701.1 putative 3-demethylubiquinone-9 3-methyltransferase (glyoxalase superfamily) [Saccharothrix violaceirubra]
MNAPKVTALLMFQGRAEEAMTFYTSLFDDGEVLSVTRYGPEQPGVEGSVVHATFRMGGQFYMCMDSSMPHDFTFTPSVSLFVECDTEAEIDRVYEALADGGMPLMPLDDYGFSAKFGWLNDRFGVSWQLNLA